MRDCRSAVTSARRGAAGGGLADDLQLNRMGLTRAEHVGRTNGESVHRAVVPRRHASGGFRWVRPGRVPASHPGRAFPTGSGESPSSIRARASSSVSSRAGLPVLVAVLTLRQPLAVNDRARRRARNHTTSPALMPSDAHRRRAQLPERFWIQPDQEAVGRKRKVAAREEDAMEELERGVERHRREDSEHDQHHHQCRTAARDRAPHAVSRDRGARSARSAMPRRQATGP